MLYPMAAALLLLCAILSLIVIRLRSSRPKHGEILPAGEMQKKYNLYAENRPEIRIDSMHVPEDLRDLIPMAEKWGIGDDIIRGDFCEKASHDEKVSLVDAVKGRTDRINKWLDSFGSAMSQDAGAFMYMLLALDEMGLYPS